MDIVLSRPSPIVLIVVIGALLAGIAALLLRKGALWPKVLGIAASVIVCTVLLLVLYREKHLVVNGAGITATSYGTAVIPWTDVTRATVVDDLNASPYKPAAKTGGTDVGDYKAGWFRLENGKTAWVTIEAAGKALVIEAGEKIYVFGLRDFQPFLSEVEKYITNIGIDEITTGGGSGGTE
jgi:hypothetical protein